MVKGISMMQSIRRTLGVRQSCRSQDLNGTFIFVVDESSLVIVPNDHKRFIWSCRTFAKHVAESIDVEKDNCEVRKGTETADEALLQMGSSHLSAAGRAITTNQMNALTCNRWRSGISGRWRVEQAFECLRMPSVRSRTGIERRMLALALTVPRPGPQSTTIHHKSYTNALALWGWASRKKVFMQVMSCLTHDTGIHNILVPSRMGNSFWRRWVITCFESLMPVNPSPANSSCFLLLPLELRRAIYKLLLPSITPGRNISNWKWTSGTGLAILRVNKQINLEASHVLRYEIGIGAVSSWAFTTRFASGSYFQYHITYDFYKELPRNRGWVELEDVQLECNHIRRYVRPSHGHPENFRSKQDSERVTYLEAIKDMINKLETRQEFARISLYSPKYRDAYPQDWLNGMAKIHNISTDTYIDSEPVVDYLKRLADAIGDPFWNLWVNSWAPSLGEACRQSRSTYDNLAPRSCQLMPIHVTATPVLCPHDNVMMKLIILSPVPRALRSDFSLASPKSWRKIDSEVSYHADQCTHFVFYPLGDIDDLHWMEQDAVLETRVNALYSKFHFFNIQTKIKFTLLFSYTLWHWQLHPNFILIVGLYLIIIITLSANHSILLHTSFHHEVHHFTTHSCLAERLYQSGTWTMPVSCIPSCSHQVDLTLIM